MAASDSKPVTASAPASSTETTSIPALQSDPAPKLIPESKTEPKDEPTPAVVTDTTAAPNIAPPVESTTKYTTKAAAEATTEAKIESTSQPVPPADAPKPTVPVAPTVDPLPVIQKEQEEFEGTVDVNNDIPSDKDLEKAGVLLVLDAKGASRPFKDLYKAPLVAPRQLIIFIRHFFCGEYVRTLSSSVKPDDLLRLPTPTFITVIGCGRPELIPMYLEATACPFPVYADPTRKLYDLLGMTRTFNLGPKPEYMHTNMLINSVQSIIQGLGSGRHALKGGDMKQVGGEFLFEEGECTWVHRMKTTRDHAEVTAIRTLLGLDGTRPPMRKKWSHDVREQDKDKDKDKRRSTTWGKLISKSKEKDGSGVTTPEQLDAEDKKLVGRPTV